MAVYDFLDLKLSPQVSTQSPTMDNYDVHNLISSNDLTRARGFLAYSATKPPVDVEFQLICPIKIHYIAICSTVGTQKCTGIEIFARNDTAPFASIGKAYFNENGVIFCNSRLYSKYKPPEKVDPSFHLCFLNESSFRTFIKTNIIRIRIFRTANAVPCLSKVEIWGQVARTCSETTMETIRHLMEKPTYHSPRPSISEERCAEAPNDFNIPEDFKDALTYEIMSMPMTLPSGNTVDQSTIEKYVSTEASHGRQASDPFTGQRFTIARKPVLNVALKSRIDMFLLQNSHREETYNIQRTVGIVQHGSKENVVTPGENPVEPSSSFKRKCRDDGDVNKKIRLDSAVCNKDGKDLDEIIKSVVTNSRFLCFTSESTEVVCKHNCVICEIDSDLYVLPCKHLYCKKCLLAVYKKLECRICSTVFAKSDPVKFHVLP